MTSYRDKPPIDFDRFTGGDDPLMRALFQDMRRRGTILDATASMWARIAADAQAEGDDDLHGLAVRNADMAAALTAQAHREGVALATGTDSDPDPDAEWPPLHDELVFLAERCGIPVLDVLRSATLVGAQSIGAERDMGSVEPGKLANLAVLAADPLTDLGAALRSIRLTVKRGHRHERGAGVVGHAPVPVPAARKEAAV
ncbi:amidohydrolase family protein [Streptacidiphilus monticola]